MDEIEKLFRAKEQRLARLAAMPFHEKVKPVVQMQQVAAPNLAQPGGNTCESGNWSPCLYC
jgi:hypothetical protein